MNRITASVHFHLSSPDHVSTAVRSESRDSGNQWINVDSSGVSVAIFYKDCAQLAEFLTTIAAAAGMAATYSPTVQA